MHGPCGTVQKDWSGACGSCARFLATRLGGKARWRSAVDAPPYAGGEIPRTLEMRVSKNPPPLPCELLPRLEFLQEIPQS